MTKQRLRVVHIITKGRPMGGAQIDTFYALRYQQSEHDVAVIAGNEGPLPEICEEAGIEAHVIPIKNVLLDPLGDLRALIRLIRYLRATRPHIVHTHTSKAGILGRAAAWIARVPVVVHTLHGPPYHDRQSVAVRWMIKHLERLWAPLTDKIVAVTDTLGEIFVQDDVCDDSRVRTIGSAIDFSLFPSDPTEARQRKRRELGIADHTRVVISVAELTKDKGHDLLIKAAQRIVPIDPDVLFLIVGPGDLEEQLQLQIDDANLRNHVWLLGARNDVPALLAASDLFVQTSWREGLSRSLIEAMYSGLPSVATNVGGTREVLRHGENGKIVAPGDVAGLSSYILALLNDPEERRVLGSNARSMISETRSITAMGHAHDELYRGVIEQKFKMDVDRFAARYHPKVIPASLDRLRIAHIITKGDPMGGAQLNTYHSLRYQQDRFEVHAVMGNDGPLGDACRALGIATTVIPIKNVLLDPIGDLRALYRMVQYLRETQPHIVHTHSSKAGILGRVAARLAGVPVVVHTLHVLPYHDRQSSLMRQALIMIERLCAPLTDHFISVADTLGADFVQNRICRSDRMATVISGIDFEAFPADWEAARQHVRSVLGIEDGTLVVITVANLEARKRLDVLVNAAAQIVATRSDVLFLIVGSGHMEEAIRRQIARLGLDSHIWMLGKRDDVPSLLAASDIFVQTSQLEGLSRSLVEAMYSRLPSVATDVNATHELIKDGETGYLVPVNNVEALAAQLQILLNQPTERERIGRNAQHLVGRTRSVEVMGAGLQAIYRQVAERKGFTSPLWVHGLIEEIETGVAS